LVSKACSKGNLLTRATVHYLAWWARTKTDLQSGFWALTTFKLHWNHWWLLVSSFCWAPVWLSLLIVGGTRVQPTSGRVKLVLRTFHVHNLPCWHQRTYHVYNLQCWLTELLMQVCLICRLVATKCIYSCSCTSNASITSFNCRTRHSICSFVYYFLALYFSYVSTSLSFRAILSLSFPISKACDQAPYSSVPFLGVVCEAQVLALV
jgi:hypothetical protein